jgi:hypothetical protein
MLDQVSIWLRDHWNRLLEFAEVHDKAIVAAGTALLAVFTIVLAIATVFLWRATRDLVHDAQDKGERQLRAYPSPTSMRLPPGRIWCADFMNMVTGGGTGSRVAKSWLPGRGGCLSPVKDTSVRVGELTSK